MPIAANATEDSHEDAKPERLRPRRHLKASHANPRSNCDNQQMGKFWIFDEGLDVEEGFSHGGANSAFVGFDAFVQALDLGRDDGVARWLRAEQPAR